MTKDTIQYVGSCDTPFHMELTLNNSRVIVGEAAGGGDGQEWEIIDGFNGQQLAFRRITGDHTDPAAIWPELMMKAHCELLTLEQMAREQAEREEYFRTLVKRAEEQITNLEHMMAQMEVMGIEAHQVTAMVNAVSRLNDAADLIDEIQDPDEEA